MVDTTKDARLGRIFMNRTMEIYPAFSEFYGTEETVERIVGFLRHTPRASKSASRSCICSDRLVDVRISHDSQC
jgi:predicted Ser/Thr protein kinase